MATEDNNNKNDVFAADIIDKIKGLEKLDLGRLRFHDAEIIKFTINYPEEGDFYIDCDMKFLWGKYSRMHIRFIGLVTYNICDDGGDRYLGEASFHKHEYNDFLVAELGAFATITCLRAEILSIEEFEDGISPAEKICKEHYESGKEGIPCVSFNRIQQI